MLLMAAVNEIFLGVDIYLAHSISGTITPYEWIPIVFGPVAGGAAAAGRADRPAPPPAGVRCSPPSSCGQHRRRACWAPTSICVAPSCPTAAAGRAGLGRPARVGAADPGPADLLAGRAAGDQRRLDRRPARQRPADACRPTQAARCPTARRGPTSSWSAWAAWRPSSAACSITPRTGFDNPWLWLPTAAGVFGTVVAVVMGVIERGRRARSDDLHRPRCC